jgi:uncharacterized protein (TIGR03435 family)
VKPSPAESKGPTLQLLPGGRFVATGFPLENLITIAYGVRKEDVFGAPSWIGSVRYDIQALASSEAKSEKPPQFAPMMQRLQRLLADRFGLKARREPRARKVLVLSVHRDGSKMQRSPENGTCNGNASVLSMAMLTKNLGLVVGEVVVDETGLTGNYCVGVAWSDETGSRQIGGRGGSARVEDTSLFSALRHQLGLELRSGQRTADVLVIERVNRPLPN